MAITLVASGAIAFSNSGGNVTPALPTGWAADDIFVLVLGTADNVVSTLPAGWTKKHELNGNTVERLTIAWKRAAAGDTDPLVTHAAGGQTMARISAFRGVVGSGDPFGASSILYNSALSTTISTTAITTLEADDMILFVPYSSTGFTTNAFSAYSGTNPAFTEAWQNFNGPDTLNGQYATLALAYGIKTDASTTGVRTVTQERSPASIGALLALTPAPASPVFRAVSAIGSSTAGTFTITLGTHATNDILLSISWYRALGTVLTPTGWTEAVTGLRGTTRYYIHWKRATSAAETNPVFDYVGVDDGFGLVANYSGAITTGTPYDVLGAFASGTAEPATLTGITTLTANSLVVALIGGEDNTGTGMTMTATNPAAFTEHYDEAPTGTDGAVAIGEAARAATGATGDVSSAFGATVVGWGGWVLALVPPAPPAAADPRPRPIWTVTRQAVARSATI